MPRITSTKMTTPLTVLIPCLNEIDHLEACIDSVRDIATEVLVADSGSTDGTLERARELGCRVIEREYITSGSFKNWAIPQATHDWVLVLDADERITPELAAEIRTALDAPTHDGYWIYRLNYFLGHPIYYGPWQNDSCLRLFRRDVGRYVGDNDHAEVELDTGAAGRLKSRMAHYTFNSYGQYLPKVSRYAALQARLWHVRGRHVTTMQMLLRGPLRFLQGYVLRRGFLDGLAGLQVCFLVAYQSYLKLACLWELEHKRPWREVEGRPADGNADRGGRCPDRPTGAGSEEPRTAIPAASQRRPLDSAA